MNLKIPLAIFFCGALLSVQAQNQESISQIASGLSSISGLPGSGSGSGSGSSSSSMTQQQALLQLLTDPCTYKTMGNFAQLLAASQQQNSGSSGSSNNGGLTGMSNVPGLSNLPGLGG